MSLLNCRVVLVRPQFAGNVGAVARVMRNMGLAELCLVAPAADPGDRKARQRATQGEAILDNVQIVETLNEALSDCVLAAATSARTGGLFRKQNTGTPDEIATRLLGVLTDAKVALVFGPEASGLSNEEIAQCHFLIHIPTDDSYSALNLAQAVGICLYELRCAWLSRGLSSPVAAPASMSAQERVFGRLRAALEAIHFLYGDKADSLMYAFRHLIGRATPSEMEIKLLHGLARQILWYVVHHP
jgi:TrmH family RNA methyltransferase